jgi:hypothetical protein
LKVKGDVFLLKIGTMLFACLPQAGAMSHVFWYVDRPYFFMDDPLIKNQEQKI